MQNSRLVSPRRKRRSSLRYVFTFAMTVVMIATNGFGALPDNPISQMFRDVIGENFPENFLAPVDSYLIDISVQPITAQQVTQISSVPEQGLDLVGILINIFSTSDDDLAAPILSSLSRTATSVSLSVSGTQTQIASELTAMSAVVAQIPVETATPVVTTTSVVSPTASAIPVFVNLPPSTRKPGPENTSTPTAAPVPAAAFSVSSVYLNGYSNSITVSPGDSVTVTYNYQITNDPCPGCTSQLVTGLGAAGSHGISCAFDGIAGASPGILGSENVALTAPTTPGTYSVMIEYYTNPNCTSAMANYGSGGIVPSQIVGQIVVVAPLILYSPGSYNGNLGGRSGSDSLCAVAGPSGYGDYRAFLSIEAGDAIVDMPANYSIPTNGVIKSTGGMVIANNWTDLLDGSVATSLGAAGVTGSGSWWSGSEDDYGSASLVAANCNNFTSSASADYGNYGDTTLNGSDWMSGFPNSQTCDTVSYLICVAVP